MAYAFILFSALLWSPAAKASGSVISDAMVTGIVANQATSDSFSIKISGGTGPGGFCPDRTIRVYTANQPVSCVDCMPRLFQIALTAFLANRPISAFDGYTAGTNTINCNGITVLDIH